MTIGIYWLTQDLRLDDNPALTRAATECDRLLCVYVHAPQLAHHSGFNSRRMSPRRQRFLQQGLAVLDHQLRRLGQQLLVVHGDPLEQLSALIERCHASRLYRSRPVGWDECQQLARLRQHLPWLHCSVHDSYTLFEQPRIRPLLDPFPASFSAFRRQLEALPIPAPLAAVSALPPPPPGVVEQPPLTPLADTSTRWFSAGEPAAQQWLHAYFDSARPQHYRQVRDALDGRDQGTRLSPWLAQGSLSARRVVARLRQHEQQQGANDSTGWILFELLWREFFQWYARHHGRRLFRRQGIRTQPPLTSFYPARFRAWCAGTTPWPLVNACMHQLQQTGWITNRSRQIVASCLVNELQLDWRYGAAWFEQELIDYDVASNWGNWQYLAGVGADPRGQRHFDLAKQTRLFDPQQTFISRWQGRSQRLPLDAVDAADWPLPPPSA